MEVWKNRGVNGGAPRIKKTPTLSIQACLNTETLSDRVAALGGDAVFITSVSRSADKPRL